MAYLIRGQQEKFKKFVYLRGNLYQGHRALKIPKIGVTLTPYNKRMRVVMP